MTACRYRRATAHLTATLTAVLLGACGPGGPRDTAPEPALEPVQPLPGDNWAMVYHEAGELRHLNTARATHERIVRGVDEMLLALPSPRGDRVASAYRTGDSTRVVVLDTETGTPTEVHVGPAGTRYAAAWSPDGRQFGVGFRGAAGGGVLVLDADGAVRDIGCSASNRFAAWRSTTEAVVHDAANFYTVSTRGCGTLTRLTKRGKDGVVWAANGRRVAWFVDRSVDLPNRDRPQAIPELWIAGHDGGGARKIADYRSRPAHARWAPDGQRIAYEVASQRWAATTHLVTYDVAADEYHYIAQEMPLGVPVDFGACWAPDGRRFAHDRLYRRSTGTQRYATRHVMVRRGEREIQVFEEIISREVAAIVAAPPERCRWIGNRHLLVSSESGPRVVAVDDGATLDLPEAERPLGVLVLEAGSAP